MDSRESRLGEIVTFCDDELKTKEITDYSPAFNGLEVENSGKVTRIGAAVDASLNTVHAAIEKGVDLLIVHHGLFWTPRAPWTGTNFNLIQNFIQGDLALYSSHLPLDIHPELGNNAQLIRSMGLTIDQPCGDYKGQSIGYTCKESKSFDEVVSLAESALGVSPVVLPCGPAQCQKIAIITGGAGSELAALAATGIDCLITGEGPHWTYALAQELQINVIYGGHYATETFGVKALASLISDKFQIPWEFIDDSSCL